MRRIAVVGAAGATAPLGDGRSDAELLGPVVDAALAGSGLAPGDVGVVCSAGSEFAGGFVGSMMDVFEVLPAWPPRTHTHLEGDGAFALYEAWVRLLAGEADVALVCAFGRPLGEDPLGVLTLQLDPYTVAPLAPHGRSVAALQARALLDTGRYDEADLAAVASARRPGLTVEAALAEPYVASPLRGPDCSTVCAGAAAVVLAAEPVAERSVPRPAWITGIDQAVETGVFGARDLTRSPSIEALSTRLGVRGSRVDVLEVHAPYGPQELLVIEALGTTGIGSLNPSGGALPADPLMATGLLRIVAAASAVLAGDARTAVAHATSGPCLQQNLLCALGADR